MMLLRFISRTRLVVLLVLLYVSAGCASPTAQAQSLPNAAPFTISVWGNGQTTTTPDRTVVTIGVETSALQASAALSQNNKQVLATTAALQKAGVDKSDIQTQSVQLYTRYDPVAPLPMSSTTTTSTQSSSYTALNTMQVTVRNQANLGSLLDAAVAVGSNRISGIRFEVSSPEAALQQARQAAWQDAQTKAQELAKLSGLQLGQVVGIQETNSLPVDVTVQATSSGPVPVAPGVQNIQINLNVTWQVR